MTDAERLNRLHGACVALFDDPDEVLPEGYEWVYDEHSKTWMIRFKGSAHPHPYELCLRTACYGLLETMGERRVVWGHPRLDRGADGWVACWDDNNSLGGIWCCGCGEHPILADACICLARSLAEKHGEPKCTCCVHDPYDGGFMLTKHCPVHGKPEQKVRRANAADWHWNNSVNGKVPRILRELADEVQLLKMHVAALEKQHGRH